MNLLVRFVPNSICIGCACHGYVEDKTHLCCSCFGLKIAVEDRKRKLSATMRAIFAPKLFNAHVNMVKQEIAEKLAAFRAG